MELSQGRFKIAVSKRFFIAVVRHQNRLPRAVDTAQSCQSSVRVWITLSDTGFEFWPCVKPEAELDGPCGSLPTWNIFMILWLRMFTQKQGSKRKSQKKKQSRNLSC